MASVEPRIRRAEPRDAAALARIYNHYVERTVVTFEEVPVVAEAMGRRVAEVEAEGLPWLVLEESGEVLGYAYAKPWRARPAYRHSVETTVYLDANAMGRGLGRRLMDALLLCLRARKKHAVIAGIALPNDGSVALHERLGMTKVAHFPEVGFKHGRWVDVAFWQMLLPPP